MSSEFQNSIASDGGIERLREIISESAGRDKNEADTRHQIIDFILHDFLSWPRNRVSVEEYVQPGYADYVLKKSNGDALLFLEAKKEGVFFEIPRSNKQDETSCFISIQKLLTDENIRSAMTQVRTYCFDTGCEFAGITNGIEWIFFKTFERGKRWEALQAFVIRNLSFFEREYTKSINYFSFTAITEGSSLTGLLTTSSPKDRNIYYPKEGIPSYSHPIAANRLAGSLRPIVNHYFGVIGDHDTEFMDRCYVSQREYQNTQDGMRGLIQDSLSPYFASYGIQQLDETGKGGQLGGRLTKNIKLSRQGEVLVLFGGKGAGKSTFIKRLLHHNPPSWLKDHSVISVIDLLKIPADMALIRKTIWDELVEKIDQDKLLESHRSILIRDLFQDRYQVAVKQDLVGLPHASEAYNVKLNALVAEWKQDKKFCAKALVNYWNQKGKGIIVVVDNTDQYPAEVQDFCFSSAQEISNELACVTLISMREERFFDSKIHGVLDAFQNSGFHISSPKPAEVFRKRLEYTISLLRDPSKRSAFLPDEDDQFIGDSCVYLDILRREFLNDNSPLAGFLTACAHGDIRLSLDLFRSFLLSGYTNVEEMIAAGKWNFLIHQVIKPVMVPNRYFYDETLSDIPNIYQIRSNRHGSHFTSLRILRKLAQTVDISVPTYLSIAELKAYFAETFNMVEDFVKNVDILLKHGFVEANNRLDTYSDAVDTIKITSYGLYMIGDLAYYFTYLDLICTDCGIFREVVSSYLTEAARKEYGLFINRDRVERVKIRLGRVEEFINYLRDEELREKDLYGLGMPEAEMFTSKTLADFSVEKTRVLASARKQENKRDSGYRRWRSQLPN